MARTLRLIVQTGPHKNRRFCFRDHSACMVGRAPDCFVQLTGTQRDCLISRHHCQLAVNEGALKLQDLGSQNGTFLNGKKIESAELPFSDPGPCPQSCQCELNFCEGAFLTIGGTTLRLDVVDCPPHGAPPDLWDPGQTAKKDCPVACVR
jgi:pSer/pThr/pTyr-binding forkhead associated (FHA) protein